MDAGTINHLGELSQSASIASFSYDGTNVSLQQQSGSLIQNMNLVESYGGYYDTKSGIGVDYLGSNCSGGKQSTVPLAAVAFYTDLKSATSHPIGFKLTGDQSCASPGAPDEMINISAILEWIKMNINSKGPS